jgi:hypothetical protein
VTLYRWPPPLSEIELMQCQHSIGLRRCHRQATHEVLRSGTRVARWRAYCLEHATALLHEHGAEARELQIEDDRYRPRHKRMVRR